MPSPPVAEVDVDERLVRSLLAEQHPDLGGRPLTGLGAGWDNVLFRLGDDLLVRLPRRAVAALLTEQEQRWLPELAPRLPLPVPAPVRVGRPSPRFPWAWSIVPWFDGEPGDRVPLSAPEDAATRLGRFLAALHTTAPPDAPRNRFRGVPLAERADMFEQRMAQLATGIDAPATRQVWERALAAHPWPGPPTWVHGDLHPANTVVARGTLAAVIDFGDLTAGDPATDVAGVWLLLPTSAAPAFAHAYGGLDRDLERRALGWAVLFALMLVAIGLEGRPTYEAAGRAALSRAIDWSRGEPRRG